MQGGRSWASAVGSAPKKPDPPKPAPPPPPAAAPSAASPPAATNGVAPPAVPNGVAAPAPVPAPPRPAAPAATPAAAPVRKAPLYEPAPNEIMRVSLVKPLPDAKLGIRLAGEERPRIISLNPEGLAAKAGCLSVGDVFLKVREPPVPKRQGGKSRPPDTNACGVHVFLSPGRNGATPPLPPPPRAPR